MGKIAKLITELEKIKDMPSAADKDPSLRYVRCISVNKAYPRIPGKCRRCGKELTGRRTAWCSNACTVDALIRCNHTKATYYIRVRDKGICSICGTDTKSTKTPGRRRSWEVDHKVPVAEGGGHCSLDNLRTACIPCHKIVTKELAFRRRKK